MVIKSHNQILQPFLYGYIKAKVILICEKFCDYKIGELLKCGLQVLIVGLR